MKLLDYRMMYNDNRCRLRWLENRSRCVKRLLRQLVLQLRRMTEPPSGISLYGAVDVIPFIPIRRDDDEG